MRWPLALLLVVAGCGDPETGSQPVASYGRRPMLAPPPEEILNPSANLRERSAEDRAAERERLGLGPLSPEDARARAAAGGSGAGGGGGSMTAPEPAAPPTAGDVERFRRSLEQELSQRIDPEDDPCDQLRDTLAAGNAAVDRRGEPRPGLPSRAATRRDCRRMPDPYVRCMDHDYFREHLDECQREIDRMARRGRRRSERARTELDRVSRGEATDPGEPEAPEDDDD